MSSVSYALWAFAAGVIVGVVLTQIADRTAAVSR